MEANDVPKVVAALRQATNNRQMLVKLMQRLEVRPRMNFPNGRWLLTVLSADDK